MKNQHSNWMNDEKWSVTVGEEQLPEFHPYFTGNGRLGLRVGPLVLDWGGEEKPLLCEPGHDFWGRLNARLLHTLARHGYDGSEQLILPAWNQLRLEIGGVEYREEHGRHHLRNILDLRSGEVFLEDRWEYQSGKSALVKVRLVLPRSHPCACWCELSLSGLTDPARVRFGLNAGQVASDYSRIHLAREENRLHGSYTGERGGRIFAQGLAWECAAWKENGFESARNHFWLSFSTEQSSATLALVHSFHSAADTPDPRLGVGHDLENLGPAGRIEAAAENRRLWREIWATGLDFRHDNEHWEKLVLLNQFHLIANFEENGHYVLGPLGLSRPGWHGSQMWDADFWIFRGMLPLWPRLARSIVAFRRRTLEAARDNAKRQGFRGAFFPWLCNDQGADITSAHYRNEIHNNAWIGLAAWEAAATLDDESFLRDTAWPVLEGVAHFFASRSTRDADGTWHIRGVLPPDESVAEGRHSSTGTCDDNVLTNVGAKKVLSYAMEAAKMLGQTAPAEWAEVACGLVVLTPDSEGVIPEYAGYHGHTIKQADTILAFYPFQLDAGHDVLRKTLEYYHGKTDRGGPLMTTQIEALLTMLHGDRERGLQHLFKEYLRYVRGPHFIPFETPGNANSIMLTGIGGLLQALIFGWYGATLDQPGRIPRLGESWNPSPTVERIEPEAVLT